MQSSTKQTQKAQQESKYDGIPSVTRIPLHTRADAARYINTQVVEAAFLQYEKGNTDYVGRVKVA